MPRIDIGEVRYFVEHFLRESQKLKEALTNYRKAVAKIIADNEIKGEIADSAKDYYEMVHYPIVDTTKACMTDAEEILKKYTTDFHNQVDPSMNARIDSDELQELQGEIRKCQNRYEDLLVKMKSMAGGSSLGQQIGMQLGMQTAMGQLQHEMQIIERYVDFDTSHQNVMYDVVTKLYQVKQGLTEIQSSKAFNTVSHTFNTKSLNMGWLKNLTPEKKDPYAKYEKTLQGNYWVLTKNGKTDAEAAEATIAYNKGINDGTIKVPRDENADLDAERIKGALDGYDPISGNNLTSMQSFSVLAGIAAGMVAIKGRGRVYPKSTVNKVQSDLRIKEYGEAIVIKRSINTGLVRSYIKDVEQRTSRKLAKIQIDALKDALRTKEYTKLTPAETNEHRLAFKQVKNKLIVEWEQKTNQSWPRYSEEILSAKSGRVIRKLGEPYDAHHLIENTFGGEHEWWNMHPAKFPDEHQAGIHGAGSPAKELFKGVEK
ncbi:hypothetical protein BMT55_08225 [Listeria newyorkensis]|uniref:LXG domain-containing protein n=1 Tax=Listeria newyorkensis TaxID=1497681 RepID=A0ABX4XNF4_9LIST|nr:T7SS effector LXG polymorphic toxin [Listeria newyorkensis]PNP92545.1 hypothetical protein BMT55_08225 [Listeria newyorkensis]